MHDLLDSIPGIIRQAVKDEFDFQKSKLQPLSHAARLIGISPTTAHNYKRAGLLAGRVDVFGKIIPRDLLAVHLQQRKDT